VLDLRNPAQQRHLTDDALLAEDLAIRHADAHRGKRSGHFEGFLAYAQTRDRCMAALFSRIARNHRVTTEQVRESLLRRRTSVDAAVILAFAVIYWFAATHLADRVCRRFPLDKSGAAALVPLVVTSLAVGFIGVLLGEQWSTTIEGIRLGTGHLSYRLARVPWVHHRVKLWVAGVLLFWLAAALRYRVGRRNAGSGSEAA